MDLRRQPAAVPARLHQPVGDDLGSLQIQTVYVMSLVVSVAMMIGMAWFFKVVEIGPGDARHRLQPAGGAIARHFRQKRIRDGLGDLGHGLRGRRRRGRRGQRRLVGPCRPTASRCFRRPSSAASTASAAPWSAASSSGCWRTSRNSSTANICTGAISIEIAPFYVLIIILMIKPYGLFGTKDIERV